MAGEYPFLSVISKTICLLGVILLTFREGGSKITGARSPLRKLSHKTGGDQQELCCKESYVVIYMYTGRRALLLSTSRLSLQ